MPIRLILIAQDAPTEGELVPWFLGILASAVVALWIAYTIAQAKRIKDLKTDKAEERSGYEERITNYRALLEAADQKLDECRERLENHTHDGTHSTDTADSDSDDPA